MCADADCLNAADLTTPGGAFCLRHDAELRAECSVGAPDQFGPAPITTECELALDTRDAAGVTLRERLARR